MNNVYKNNIEAAQEYCSRILTPREKDVMNLLSTGLLDKEIAYNLGLSLNTVKNHLKNIYQKLNVNNRLEAVIYYYGIRA